MIERRQTFLADEAKFSTQRVVTYVLLLIFACVTGAVFLGSDKAERSTVIQTVINFTLLAIGFWLGTSKGAADNREQLNRIVEAATPTVTPREIKTSTMNVTADTANVMENSK